ncbi:3-hydroxyacyl-ACP dehydratase [Bacillus sp. DNRA2]|uniref:MaoC/PaaZ C-terminal domain-containing protein n=1 Tax=Bacillus sp. DNRA2 TaxID=2723053 RepID=UPI00145E9680|nr:MaoC/PaaZ C-terminal domain-containing protein [Bacillus sp. DNRA2]NMD71450.1 3-hydroxyacyl-ACP dehydratase [Bacillus sp. DNRA2]
MKILQPLEKQPISHSQLVRYAGASGDFNPIHTVVPVAQQAGLGDVIAHGMLVMGFAGQALTQWFPRQNLRDFKVRFVKMTHPGEKLIITGQITEEIELAGETRWLGELFVKSDNEVKLSGRFEVVKKDNK